MTVWYVGPGGNDNNSGRTWGTRLLTLNGAEDKPVVAGDTVYVAPGVYRELLTVDVSGTAGNPITYIGDVTGEHTDGVGGPVRITGSDNDQTVNRARCIFANARDYRIFRGLWCDGTTSDLIYFSGDSDNNIIEDCCLQDSNGNGSINFDGTSNDNTVRRCFFLSKNSNINSGLVRFSNSVTHDDSDNVVENCVMLPGHCAGIIIDRVGGVTIRNCYITSSTTGVYVRVALAVGQSTDVNNCILVGNNRGVAATALGEIVENYNTFFNNLTDRVNTNVGGNSVAYMPLMELPLLNAGAGQLGGFRLPFWIGTLSKWSQIREITGSNEPDEDFFGIRRPFTHGGPIASLCSWGAIQHFDTLRSDAQAYEGSLSALVREGDAAWMFVPGISATSHTISVRSYRTAGYGGHRNPTMTIKQSGQADRVTIAGGAAGAWVQLSDTFTPAADPPWLIVEMRNTCDFTTTTTVSTTSTTTVSTTSTSTATVSTLTTTTTTLACDVWWDDLQVA